MDASEAEIRVLFWIFLLALIAVLAAIVGLARGRAVPPATMQLRAGRRTSVHSRSTSGRPVGPA